MAGRKECIMFKAARHEKIKEILLNQKQINVQTLSLWLNVSPVTIRSDFEELEKQGFLVRTHGGAILKEAPAAEQAAQSVCELSPEARRIAKTAAALIPEGAWTFLGPGEICRRVAEELVPRGSYHIITNELTIPGILSKNPANRVIVTGGSVVPGENFLTGELFRRSISRFNIARAFFEVGGVDLTRGFSVSSEEAAYVYEALITDATNVTVLAEGNRFGQLSFVPLGSLELAKAVVSDESVPDPFKEYLFKHNIQLYTSLDIPPAMIGTNYL